VRTREIRCGQCAQTLHHCRGSTTVISHTCCCAPPQHSVADLMHSGLVERSGCSMRCLVCGADVRDLAMHACEHPLWRTGVFDISGMFSPGQMADMDRNPDSSILRQLGTVCFVFPAPPPRSAEEAGVESFSIFKRGLAAQWEQHQEDWDMWRCIEGGWPLLRFHACMMPSSIVSGEMGIFASSSQLCHDDTESASSSTGWVKEDIYVPIQTRKWIAPYTGVYVKGSRMQDQGTELRSVRLLSQRYSVVPRCVGGWACMLNQAHGPAANACINEVHYPWQPHDMPSLLLMVRAVIVSSCSNSSSSSSNSSNSSNSSSSYDDEFWRLVAEHPGFGVDNFGELSMRQAGSCVELLWFYRASCDWGDRMADIPCACTWCTGVLQLPPELEPYAPSRPGTLLLLRQKKSKAKVILVLASTWNLSYLQHVSVRSETLEAIVA
jgi:hypothetical protein